MANDVANFKPSIWSKKLQQNFDQKGIFPGLVDRDYEGEIKNAGDTVYIRAWGDITMNDYTRNSTISFEDLDDPMTTMTINEQKYFAFKVDDLDKAQADVDILNGYSERAAQAASEVVDLHLHANYASVDADNIIGTSGSPITLTAANIYGYLVDMAKKLDDKHCPDSGRNLVINPAVKALLRKSDEFIHATDKGDGVIRNGMIGEVAGMNVFCSTNLNTVGGNTPLLVFHKSFMSYASQVAKTEAVRPSNMFANGVKGLYLYDSVVPVKHDGNGAVLWVSNA